MITEVDEARPVVERLLGGKVSVGARCMIHVLPGHLSLPSRFMLHRLGNVNGRQALIVIDLVQIQCQAWPRMMSSVRVRTDALPGSQGSGPGTNMYPFGGIPVL